MSTLMIVSVPFLIIGGLLLISRLIVGHEDFQSVESFSLAICLFLQAAHFIGTGSLGWGCVLVFIGIMNVGVAVFAISSHK